MKIGIDASRAFLSQRTGTEEYSYQLIKHLARLETSAHQIILYARKGARPDFPLPRNFSLREIGGDFLWTQISLSAEIFREKPDILFIPSHSVPFIHPKRTAVTIHGLEYKECPECYALKDKLLIGINSGLSIRFASKIIVPSQSTKNSLEKYYCQKAGKAKVIRHGSKGPEIFERKESGGFNILFVGRMEKRKNIAGIIRGFELFAREIEDREKIRLIMAGKPGFGFGEAKKTINDSGYKDRIILMGYVDEKEKIKLYKAADVLLFPSFAEGFGFPILEAMSYGVPVITSDAGAMAEIGGAAASLVNPFDSKSIAEAINLIYGSGEKRREMREKGYENLRRFDWTKCAKETLEYLTSE